MMYENYFEPPGEAENGIPETNGIEKELEEAAIADTGDDEPRDYASDGEVSKALYEAFGSDTALFSKLKYHAIKWYALTDFKKKATEKDADNIVIEAVLKISCLKRKWNREKVPDIVNFIMLVIVSEIRNGRKKKNPYIRERSFYNKDGEFIGENNKTIVRAILREEILNGDAGEQVEDWINKLFNKLEKTRNTNAYNVLKQLLDLDRAVITDWEVHIANELKISVAEVKNAVRCIKRNIHQLIKN